MIAVCEQIDSERDHHVKEKIYNMLSPILVLQDAKQNLELAFCQLDSIDRSLLTRTLVGQLLEAFLRAMQYRPHLDLDETTDIIFFALQHSSNTLSGYFGPLGGHHQAIVRDSSSRFGAAHCFE
jgi:hypothetical protein